MKRCLAVALLTPVMALGAANLQVNSTNDMELRLRGEYVVLSAGGLARFKAVGPGRFVVYVVPGGQKMDERATAVPVEIFAGEQALLRQTVAATRLDGWAARGTGGNTFLPSGYRRISVDLLPGAQIYSVKVGAPSAVAAFRVAQAPKGIRIPEVALRPEGKKTALVTFVDKERWAWGSVCDRVRVLVPGPGALRIQARIQLEPTGDLPPPSFVRALSQGAVKATAPITAATEQGLEFAVGRSSFGAGTLKSLVVYATEAAEYEIEMAAWGCVNGVGFQFVFERGALAPPRPLDVVSSTPSPKTTGPEDAGESDSAAELAQCSLMLEDMARVRALEYLDSMVASGVIPASKLLLRQSSELGESFLLESISYALDGVPYFQSDAPEPNLEPFGERQLIPGPHILEVKAVLRGQGTGKFSHLNQYVIRVSKKESFIAEAGRRYGARFKFVDRGGFATPFKERPAVEVEIKPETP